MIFKKIFLLLIFCLGSNILALSFLLKDKSSGTKVSSTIFKQEHSFEKRLKEASNIRLKYPDRVPVICERAERSVVADIDKKKYLVPLDLTIGQFIYVIRNRIKLPSEEALFVFIDNIMPPTATLMSEIYEEKKDADGFLYITYSGENTFG